MSYRKGIFRCLFSFLLTVAIVLTSAPIPVRGEESGKGSEISISLKQKEYISEGDGTEAVFEAGLTGGGAVDVSIALDAAEAAAFYSFYDETGVLPEEAALETETGEILTLKSNADKSAHLEFTLDGEHPQLRADILLRAAGDEEVSLDIDESDITFTVLGENVGTPELKLDAETITVPVPAAEGDDPADDTRTEEEETSGTDSAETPGVDAEVRDGNGLATGNLELRSTRATTVTETYPASTKKIFWVDNNNEDGVRPDLETYKQGISLSFSLDAGANWSGLTQENMTDAHLDTFPQIEVSESGTTYEVKIPELPKKATNPINGGEDTIHWKIDYPEPGDASLNEDYSIQEVTEDDKDQYGVSTEGIYYIIREEFIFDIVLRTGGMQITEEMEQQLENELNDKVIFYIDRKQSYTLAELMNGTNVRVEDWTDESYGENTAHMAVINLWRYDLNGNPVEFYMQSNVEIMSPWAGTAGLTGDWIAVAYENSGVPNYGTVTDKVHNGGILYLTLEGNTSYTANKVWLDDGDSTDRPKGEFQLWRYREGEPYSSAAPVRDSKGDILSVELDASQNSYTFTFDKLNENDAAGSLPEYDAEGHRYIYVAREYYDGSSNGYEMVFGSVSADGSVTDTLPADMAERAVGNDFVYNGGTLSNRRTGNVSPKAVKRWKAAAFQSDFDDVTVELTLQRRVKPADGAADDGSGWTDVMENGQPVKKEMDGFRAETLTDTVSASVPGYDDLGKELEYRWVETGVYQGDQPDNLLNTFDGTFTLVHDMDMALQGGNKTVERQITYKSSAEMNGGESVITNRIANTVDYTIEKIWKDENGSVLGTPPAGASASFVLYQSLSGQGLGTKVAEVTLNGTVDDAPASVTGSPLTNLTFQETEEWTGVIGGLPEFDEDGQPYEYVLVETSATANSQDYYAHSYTTYRDDTDYGYHTEVVNVPGKGNHIMVRKDWVDDGDVRHRSPVVVTAYRKGTNEELGSVTLRNGLWYGWISWDDNVDPSNVYVLETEVGGDKIPLQTYDLDVGGEPSYEAKEPVLLEGTNTDHTYIQYKTDDHACEATYSVIGADDPEGPGELCWVVTNRRLGNIDLTVTKSWVDGDGELRAQIAQHLADNSIQIVPAVRLTFADEDKAYAESQGYTIGYTGVNDREDYVNIGGVNVTILDKNGDGVSSAQELDLSGAPGDTQTFHFYNLPKYDKFGKVIHYSVEEIWVVKDASGTVVDRDLIGTPGDSYYDKELWDMICDYTNSITRNEYTVGEHHGGHDDHDKQSVEMTNALTGSKEIKWYKVWKDEYIYAQGKRPDIFLDIYQLTRDKDGKPEISVYSANYKWEYAGGDSDHQRFWAVTINGVPKYDKYGYEITYFAVEKTNVQSSDFDYTDVQYSLDGEELGDEYKPSGGLELDDGFVISDGSGGNGTADPVYVMADISGEGEDPHYTLTEGGTFTNAIRRSVVIEGRKIWGNLPDGYLEANLPSITFTLYQRVGSETPVEVAEITVDDWESVKLGSSYVYGFEYAGTNKLTVDDAQGVTITGEANAAKLQKYNENGQLYDYTVEETINWDEDILDSLPGQPTITPVNVFGTEYNGFRITNRYSPADNQGALTVKKLFEIPVDENGNPEAYPAVTFKLTRTYKDNEGNDTEDVRFSRTAVWRSQEVNQAYADQSAALNDSLVTHTITWDALDIYAPNGSRYQYSVTEVKNNLNGYNTWIKKEDVNTLADFEDSDLAGYGKDAVATGLTPHENNASGNQADVTFANQRNEDQGMIVLNGTKIWDDIGNIFHSRPDEEMFARDYLALYRRANTQLGENNGIAETPVPEDSYEITAVTGGDGDQYDYTITGTNGELEKYAPNGMPWRYTLKETLPQGSPYQASQTSVTVSATDPTSIDETKTYAAITNSTTTVSDFQKIWQDSDGNLLAGDTDYLGADVSVTLKLQVTEGNGAWTDAEKYFSDQLDNTEYQALLKKVGAFEKTLTGRINARTGWSGSFTSLPQTIVKKNETAGTALSYRVVESMIAYGTTKTDVTVTDKADGTYEYTYSDALFSPGAPDGGNPVNMLRTTELSVTKTWADDTGNKYGTRPDSDRTDKVWQASFVIQRKTDDGEWENVKTYGKTAAKGSDLTVTLYGGTDASGVVEDRVTEMITGLPAASLDGEVYEYRARELQPGFNTADGSVSSQDIVADGGTYGLIYTAAYIDTAAGTEAVNTLETMDISAQKIWIDKDETDRPSEVTVALIINGGSTVIAETQTSAAGNWEYRFEKLPVRDKDGQKIEYSVVEKDVPEKYEVQYDRDYVIKIIHKGGLAVSKTVEGNAGETEREFHFKVTLSDKDFNGSYNEMEFVNGVAEFTLKDGESKAVADVISPGTTYVVEEIEADQDGYVTKAEGGEGAIDAQAVAKASFTNTKTTEASGPDTPPGGDPGGDTPPTEEGDDPEAPPTEEVDDPEEDDPPTEEVGDPEEDDPPTEEVGDPEEDIPPSESGDDVTAEVADGEEEPLGSDGLSGPADGESQTGDTSALVPVMLMPLLSGAVCVYIIWIRRKRRQTEKVTDENGYTG